MLAAIHPASIPGRSESRISRLLARVAIALLLCCGLASAQSTTGTVLGSVKDASGAAISGANVKLTNTGTNSVRNTTSNEGGGFQVPNLEPGSYRLEITAVGFEQVRFNPFDLGARETKRLDADLKIATQTTT